MEPPGQVTKKVSNESDKSEKISELKTQVSTVSAIVHENIDKLLEREFQLDTMQKRSEELKAASETFKMTARKSKREMWWINAKWKIITAISLLILFLVVTLIILRFFGQIK